MSWLHGLRHRAYVLLRGEAYAQEIEREVRFHLELAALAARSRHSTASGLEAELSARKAFGNVTFHREETRRMTMLRWLDHLRQDLAYAWRGLRRAPGFAITVVLTLGLGLGVNAAMFSFLDRVFVRAPSGVVAPREVRRLYEDLARPEEPTGRQAFETITYPQYRAIVEADSSLAMAAFTQPDSSAVIEGEARRPIRQTRVTGGYFTVLGIRPELGRFFVDEETRIESPTPVAILSDAFWHRAYDGDSSIIGKTISLNFRPFTVIGVAQKDFTGLDLDAVDIWRPANTYASSEGGNGAPWYETFHSSFAVIARLPDQRAEARFLAAATNAFRSVHLEHYVYDSTARVRAGPIVEALGPGSRDKEISISVRLAGVAIIVLMIACANVANLLLVRATHRRREIAVRRALGVSRARLCEQLLVESVLLAALGGTVAIVFTLWAGTALRRLLLPSIQWAQGAVDPATLAFIAIAAFVVGILAGLAPALHANQPDLTSALRAGSREAAYPRSLVRAALLVVQAALSVILLVGAGLFVRSLSNVRALDLGYDVEHTLFVGARFSPSPPPAPEILGAAMVQVAERLAATPGVEATGYASAAPMTGAAYEELYLPDRDSIRTLGDAYPSFSAISPGFLRATGARLIAGRDFGSGDIAGAQNVLIVTQSMARVFWPGENPIGKCLIQDKRTNPCSIVVGVVGDVHVMRVIEKPALRFFVPAAQATAFQGAQTIVVRTSSRNFPAAERASALELKRALPTMRTPWIVPMSRSLEREFRPWKLGASLFTAFGILALVVAAIGVYSVVAYAVSQRTHEFGVRIALGASVPDLLEQVVGESFKVVALGVALGIVASLVLSTLVASLLYSLSPRDPLVVTVAAALLCAIGIAASVIPAWRAAAVDPMKALRAD